MSLTRIPWQWGPLGKPTGLYGPIFSSQDSSPTTQALEKLHHILRLPRAPEPINSVPT